MTYAPTVFIQHTHYCILRGLVPGPASGTKSAHAQVLHSAPCIHGFCVFNQPRIFNTEHDPWLVTSVK